MANSANIKRIPGETCNVNPALNLSAGSVIVRQVNRKLLYAGLFFLTIVIIIWSTFIMGIYDLDSVHQLATKSNNRFIFASISILLMVLSAVTPLPAEAVSIANGMVFGPLIGTLITWASALLGAYLTYNWSDQFKNSINSQKLNKEKWKKINNWINRWGIFGFLIARLLPTVPFFALNIAAPFLPISRRSFLLITAIAILPYAITFCYIGGQFV